MVEQSGVVKFQNSSNHPQLHQGPSDWPGRSGRGRLKGGDEGDERSSGGGD